MHRSDKARSHVTSLMGLLDRSLESWEGRNISLGRPQQQDQRSNDNDSLSYIFNTLPSPCPTPTDVSCRSAKIAMRSLLGADSMRGLKTQLYPYQKRSAAEMIRREFEPRRRLDPRFEAKKGPTGQPFYYSSEKGIIYCDPREYDDARGGILAETMGLGKTLICLATILATKGHCPSIPSEHSLYLYPIIRPKVGSLMQMAAATAGREQIPFRNRFQELADAGAHYESCVAILEGSMGSYQIPKPASNRRIQPAVTKWEKINLCPVTLILLPPNLFHQWRKEVSLHLEEDALKVLYMESVEAKMPSTSELISYDVIIMSQRCFEQEFSKENYRSPLQELHFLRVIADEGHAFASSTGWKNKATEALQNLRVERRWVVSGTPAAGLLGVEVNLAANETPQGQPAGSEDIKKFSLACLRKASPLGQEQKDLLKLGSLVTDFLSLSPWVNSRNDDFASWNNYIMPRKSGCRKRCLRPVLESLVVRHQIEDVEADIRLPPLYNQVVYLQPSWHDKLSINLFVLSLTSNIVTSERDNLDYIFHHRNRAQLNTLISNLRQSGFYWTGFSPYDVGNTLRWSIDYLTKSTNPNWSGNTEDRKLLISAVNMGRLAKESASWKAFAVLSEIGIYVENFPENAYDSWSLVNGSKDDPLLAGATQLIEAQRFVDKRLYDPSPSSGLASLGRSLMEEAWQRLDGKARESNINRGADQGESPRKKQRIRRSKCGGAAEHAPGTSTVASSDMDSQLARAKITGTASAKFSYLLDRIIALHQEEKIIIFYEGDQIAFYIAQGLDLLKVQYRIYTSTLSQAQRNEYIATFNHQEWCRVFLMNVHLAAHGLHLAVASRVFFVNPIWQPNVEAQAIKRAHRIGQTRPVYVETLVLKDTLENQMHQRRKQMTTEEHQTAKKSLLDDPNMFEVIQAMKPIRITLAELDDVQNHMARLETPQQLFGRGGVASGAPGNPVSAPVVTNGTDTPQKAKQGRKRKVAFLTTDESPPNLKARGASPELG